MPLSSGVPDLPRRVFAPIARDYDTPALVLSLFRYRAWHRFLLSRLNFPPGARVLDMATGTGTIALDIHQRGVDVVACDITRAMLRRAQERADRADVHLDLVECAAETPPFQDGSFAAITFAYLLRYVDDVPGTLESLGRLLKHGGVMASLDFAVPHGIWYPLWRLYTAVVLPAGGRLFSRDWQSVCTFLGPNIRDFYRRWPEHRLRSAWRDAGFTDVRSRRLTVGGAVITWGTRP
jgi:demethylmenaquinone methyltransferase/2-methoxy-6-polyprenyl-1,4-benzoquinol methylase